MNVNFKKGDVTMKKEATEKIMLAVKIAKERANEAEERFEEKEREIQMMSSKSIDLFGNSAVSNVANIVTESKKVCDDLFASYQSLVFSIDETCRPILSENPDSSAIKEVFELIKFLNKESEIENNFTASLNDRSLGDMASGRYTPSIEAKMIEHYWEDKYSSMPDVIEMRAQKKAEDENRDKKLEEEYKLNLENYEQELKKWEQECRETEQTREDELEKEYSAKKEKITKETEDEYIEGIEKLNQEIDSAKEIIADATKTLNELGFFAFKEKSQQKRIVEEENNKLAVLKNKISSQEAEYSKKKKKDAKCLEKFKSDLEGKLEKKYPTPQKPKKPKKPLIGISTEGMTPAQIANEQIMADLVDFLSEDTWRLYTAKEIVMDCEDVSQYVPQKIEALLGQLVKRGIVECFTEKGKNFYKINENYQR